MIAWNEGLNSSLFREWVSLIFLQRLHLLESISLKKSDSIYLAQENLTFHTGIDVILSLSLYKIQIHPWTNKFFAHTVRFTDSKHLLQIGKMHNSFVNSFILWLKTKGTPSLSSFSVNLTTWPERTYNIIISSPVLLKTLLFGNTRIYHDF